MTLFVLKPSPLFFILGGTILTFKRFVICVFIPYMLFEGIYSSKFGAAFLALMLFQSEIVLALDMIQKMTSFSEALGTFGAFVKLISRIIKFISEPIIFL